MSPEPLPALETLRRGADAGQPAQMTELAKRLLVGREAPRRSVSSAGSGSGDIYESP